MDLRHISIREANGTVAIEARPLDLPARIGLGFVWFIFMALGWSMLVFSFFGGSGELAIKVIFGTTAVLSTFGFIVTETWRTHIWLTEDRLRWRRGNAVFGRTRDFPWTQVARSEVQVRSTQGKNPGISFLVCVQLTDGNTLRVAGFPGTSGELPSRLLHERLSYGVALSRDTTGTSDRR